MTNRPADDQRHKAPKKPAGNLFVVSAPSGAGKTTICRHVRDRIPELFYSVSFTTRAPRAGEIDGVDYHFISEDTFEKKIRAGKWAEWARVHGNYYGTAAATIEQGIASGQDILLDIDVQGTIQLLNKFPDAITVFIMPASFDVLRQRLESRGTDSPEVIAKRLHNARQEMDRKDLYQHHIVNDILQEAIAELTGIIQYYRGRPVVT